MNKTIHEFLRKCKRLALTPVRLKKISDSSKKKEAILKEKRDRKGNRIKVGFIVQMPEVWDKEAPLFEAIIKDNRFDAYLIIVPHYDFAKSKLGKYGEEKRYFIERYPDAKTILLSDEQDMVIDKSFDYVFYQRCYENYLPEQLRCKNVINFAMTCYMPYCFHGAIEKTSYYEKEFFFFLNKFYCYSRAQCEQVNNIKGVNCSYFGIPAIDTLNYSIRQHDSINILWTPRWTDDPNVGGTTFNKYRENILEILNVDKILKLILRPHPLTFENAIKQRWMTESEVEEYKERVVNSGALFDSNKYIEDTFLDTDILITDYTSSIISFFVSGKPIIYCAGSDFEMIDTYRYMIDSLYVAKEWDDVLKFVGQLMSGNDPLFEKRQNIIQNIKGDGLSVERIIKDLVESINN